MVRMFFVFFIWNTLLSAETFPAVKDSHAAEFINKYCFECHGDKKVKGKVDFRDITFSKHSKNWTEVLNQIEEGEMPPEDKAQPSKEEKLHFGNWVKAELLKQFRESNKTQIRLMSIDEYAATVRDLFDYNKLDFDPSSNLFNNASDRHDTIAGKQNVSSYTIGSYFKVADILVNRYVRDQWKKPEQRTWNVTNEFLNTYKWNSDKNKTYASLRSSHATKLAIDRVGRKRLSNQSLEDHEEGLYKFTVDFSGHFRNTTLKSPYLKGYDANEEHALIFYAIPPQQGAHALGREKLNSLTLNKPLKVKDGERRQATFISHMGKGFIPYYAYYNGPSLGKPETVRMRNAGIVVDAENYKGPQIHLYSVKIEGPFYKIWPPKHFVKTFGHEKPQELNSSYFYPRLKKFVSEAFKRNVEDFELKKYMELFNEKFTASGDFWLSARIALKAVLMTPEFLYINDLRDNTKTELSARELATRLSYFLWGTIPDKELLELANNGNIQNAEDIKKQTERLIQDPKSELFVKRFLYQWLELNNIKELPPSADKFKRPYYMSGIQFRINMETELFFEHILRNDFKMDLFIDSDFTFLDDKMARFYGLSTDIYNDQLKHTETNAGGIFSLSNADKSKFKKYSLPKDSLRGGILTQASVLIATSNGVDTNPVKRGIWILENILDNPPPPAPDDVPAIEQSGENKAKSLIDLLAHHRENAACAKCHDKIDPMGVPMEGFDPIGRLRTKYENRAKVEAKATNSNGTVIDGVKGLKQHLLKNKEMFYHCLAKKLTEYAIGRELQYFHEEELKAIVKRTVSQGAGLKTLIKEITSSQLFRER